MRHYKYRDSVIAMDGSTISSVYDALEGRLRTGEIKYEATPEISGEQLSEMRSTWPTEILAKIKAKIAQSGATKVDGAVAYEAMKAVLLEELPKMRGANSATATPNKREEQRILADISMSMALGVAPSASTEHIRVVKGKKIDIRTLVHSSRLVVNDCDIDNADIYVCAMANESSNRAIVIGWTTKEALRAAKRGNRVTDPGNCSWSKMSFWMDMSQLSPMIELMRPLGIKKGYPGFVLESVPTATDLPIPESSLDDMAVQNTAARDKYYTDLGIEDPLAAVKEQPQAPAADPKGSEFEF